MYPAELEIKDMADSNTFTSYLDFLLSIKKDGQHYTSISHYLIVHITIVLSLSSNILSSFASGDFFISLYDMPGYSHYIHVFILWVTRIYLIFPNKDTSWNAYNTVIREVL